MILENTSKTLFLRIVEAVFQFRTGRLPCMPNFQRVIYRANYHSSINNPTICCISKIEGTRKYLRIEDLMCCEKSINWAFVGGSIGGSFPIGLCRRDFILSLPGKFPSGARFRVLPVLLLTVFDLSGRHSGNPEENRRNRHRRSCSSWHDRSLLY